MMPYIVSDKRWKPRTVLATSIVKYRLTTGRLGPLPSFIIIGAQRGGTTSLYDQLLEHPSIYPGLAKEVQYFDRHFGNGQAWYRANFAPHLDTSNDTAHRHQITGEATANYLFHPHAPKRIYNTTPDVKLIVLLRNPVARAFSHFNLMCVQGTEHLAFEDAIELEAQRVHDDNARLLWDESFYPRSKMRYAYVSKGVYADQLPLWMERFPSDQLLILQSEAMYQDSDKVLGQVTSFLGLPPREHAPLGIRRKFGPPPVTLRGVDKPVMNQATRDYLKEFYRPHNERLFELLGEDYGWND